MTSAGVPNGYSKPNKKLVTDYVYNTDFYLSNFVVVFNLQTLPELSRIPDLVLPGSAFSDCLMLVQFLCSFGKVLGLDKDLTMLNLNDLQVGLLNMGDRMSKVQDLLVSMLSAAVCDPGIPTGHKVGLIVIVNVLVACLCVHMCEKLSCYVRYLGKNILTIHLKDF